jgi:hypothetical protein
MRLHVAFKSAERLRRRMLALSRRIGMTRKKPATPDPGEKSDWGSHAQTDKPWKGNPEKEQRPGDQKPDLEKWHESNTH